VAKNFYTIYIVIAICVLLVGEQSEDMHNTLLLVQSQISFRLFFYFATKFTYFLTLL